MPPTTIPLSENEADRLAALHRYQLLDTEADADFDLLASVAAELCGTPYAFVSLVDADRVWYKSSYGVQAIQSPRGDDYCSWAILEDGELSISDLTKDPRTQGISLTVGPPYYRMYSGANLITHDGHRIGTLCVLDTEVRELNSARKQLLARLARQVVALMELRLRDRELETALSTMERLAMEDALTGLLNRRAWMQKLHDEFERSKRFALPLALLLLDLDHFKQINDRHGHAMGDAVLKGVAEVIQARVRSVDVAGRYGGEELCILLPGTDQEGASTLAEQIRAAIANSTYGYNNLTVAATASIGIASLPASSPDALLAMADAAMYEAKSLGRNQVCVAR